MVGRVSLGEAPAGGVGEFEVNSEAGFWAEAVDAVGGGIRAAVWQAGSLASSCQRLGRRMMGRREKGEGQPVAVGGAGAKRAVFNCGAIRPGSGFFGRKAR